jgi:hypothetical protein
MFIYVISLVMLVGSAEAVTQYPSKRTVTQKIVTGPQKKIQKKRIDDESHKGICYCTVKCGPREVKPEDNPRLVRAQVRGKNGKITKQDVCMCADRDEAIYLQNPRKCVITEEDVKQLNACAKPQPAQRRVTTVKKPVTTTRRVMQ